MKNDKNKKKYSNDSIDNVVDKFLIEYEKGSLISADIKESFDLRRYILNDLLTEAEKEQLKNKNDLDTIEFCEKIVRLAENYDNLINMRDIILSRAVNYVLKNHGKEAALNLEKNLREQFDIEINRTSIDKEYDYHQPYAIRSGGGAT